MFKKKSPLKATRLAQHKRNVLYAKIGVVVVTVLIIFGGVIWLTHSSLLKISDIQVSGNVSVDSDQIKNIVNNDIAGSYLHLFSRSNRFIYPKKLIQHDILTAFPRLETVTLHVVGHELQISVTERIPAYTWCNGIPENVSSRTCYFLDDQGYVFGQAPVFSGNAFFAFYGLIPGDSPITSYYLNKNLFLSTNGLLKFLETNKIHPYALDAATSTDGSPAYIFKLYYGENSKIIFKSDQNIQDIINYIQAIIRTTHLFDPNTLPRIDSMDLRYGDKVYYTYSGDNSTTTPK